MLEIKVQLLLCRLEASPQTWTQIKPKEKNIKFSRDNIQNLELQLFWENFIIPIFLLINLKRKSFSCKEDKILTESSGKRIALHVFYSIFLIVILKP
jgi:hypothetical protein